MSLATRLSGFFLLALALVLGGFSATLYLLARMHFQRDLDERLVTALDILSASADVEADKIEWQPAARPLVISAPTEEDTVRWVVSDGRLKILDRVWNDIGGDDVDAILGLSPDVGHIHDSYVDHGGGRWRLAVRRIRPGSSTFMPADHHSVHEGFGNTSRHHLPGGPDEKGESLILAAGAPLGPMEASLRNVEFILAGLSVGIWLLAALVGRRLCNRALLPVTRMAKAACAMTSVDRDQRLPSPATGDELDALANSFNGLLDRLQEAFERQKRFAGDASHQLRTPLTALLGQLEVAQRRDRTLPEYKRVLDDARTEAVKLCRIVDALLFMARVETEAGRPDLQTLDLAHWLRDHLREWSAHPRHSDIQTEIPLETPVWVRAHAPLLGQLLDNLLDNACKYSTPGSPVIVRLSQESGIAALAVIDHGFGLDSDDLNHVFEAFFRSAEVRRRGHAGVGLGLAIAHRIAAVFGGTIAVESAPGKGSRFVLRLPVVKETNEDAVQPEPLAAMARH